MAVSPSSRRDHDFSSAKIKTLLSPRAKAKLQGACARGVVMDRGTGRTDACPLPRAHPLHRQWWSPGSSALSIWLYVHCDPWRPSSKLWGQSGQRGLGAAEHSHCPTQRSLSGSECWWESVDTPLRSPQWPPNGPLQWGQFTNMKTTKGSLGYEIPALWAL